MNSLTVSSSKHSRFHMKEPGSAITHLIGVVIALVAAPPLLIRAFSNSAKHGISMILFLAGVILLYCASTIYHSLNISEGINLKLRKIDHMMIYMLIAGTYSPVCLIALSDFIQYYLGIGTAWNLTGSFLDYLSQMGQFCDLCYNGMALYLLSF